MGNSDWAIATAGIFLQEKEKSVLWMDSSARAGADFQVQIKSTNPPLLESFNSPAKKEQGNLLDILKRNEKKCNTPFAIYW